jgi:Phosphotransferase system IIC components, glucose/maltose/N-acetylglucosamine-specific
VLAGLSFMLMHLLNVGVGITFSGGLIDLVLFGVMQGTAKTHWMWVVVVRCGVLSIELHHSPIYDLHV